MYNGNEQKRDQFCLQRVEIQVCERTLVFIVFIVMPIRVQHNVSALHSATFSVK